MKKLAWFAGAWAVVLLACPSVFAQDGEGAAAKPKKARKAEKPAKEKKAKEKSALRGEYAIMASVLGFDDAQKAKLVEAVEASKAALQQWREGPDGKKFLEVGKAYEAARKADDKDKAKQLRDELKTIRESHAKVEQACKQRIMDVLTDEQKSRWAAFNIERQVLRRLSKAELTDDQKKQVKDLCAEAAKSIESAKDNKAKSAAERKLMTDVQEKVLTDAQREALKKKPAEKAEKKEKPEKKNRRAAEKDAQDK